MGNLKNKDSIKTDEDIKKEEDIKTTEKERIEAVAEYNTCLKMCDIYRDNLAEVTNGIELAKHEKDRLHASIEDLINKMVDAKLEYKQAFSTLNTLEKGGMLERIEMMYKDINTNEYKEDRLCEKEKMYEKQLPEAKVCYRDAVEEMNIAREIVKNKYLDLSKKKQKVEGEGIKKVEGEDKKMVMAYAECQKKGKRCSQNIKDLNRNIKVAELQEGGLSASIDVFQNQIEVIKEANEVKGEANKKIEELRKKINEDKLQIKDLSEKEEAYQKQLQGAEVEYGEAQKEIRAVQEKAIMVCADHARRVVEKTE